MLVVTVKRCDRRAMERLCMRKVREVLRLTEMGRSQREVAAVLRISVGTVVGYLKRSRVAALTWERAAEMTDEAVEAELFRDVGRNLPTTRAPIPFARVHQDLSRVGVTLELLWEEYQAAALAAGGSVPYRYSQFCELYGAWRRRLSPTMRQVHRAGEKAFIDYSGKKPCIYDRHTGAAEPVELFVMVLGASNYTYAEATRTQRLADFTASVARGLEYFGAAPEVLVPDQLRSAVRGSDWYDPLINEVFQDLAQHYGLAVLPARPRKARDKAKVENAVLVAQRWVVARLRNRKFFSLSELNEAITELLEELNARPFKKLEGCRQSAFLELDRPAMHPLPVVRFELRERHKARVNIDYHVEFDYRLYSIPYTLIGEQIEVRATATVVEIFHAGERAASHARSYGRRGTSVTCHEHRPPQHQQLKWPPERLVSWAAKFGPAVATVVERTLAQYVHPKHGYRACLGILRVAEKHGAERMQSACSRALAASSSRAPHRKYIEAILRQGLDRQPTPPPVSRTLPLQHENVRGGEYYDRKETIH